MTTSGGEGRTDADEWSVEEVSTAGLRSSEIPKGGESLEYADGEPEIWRFARTYDPRNLLTESAALLVTNWLRAEFEREGDIAEDADLELLRSCLLQEYLYWRHTGPGGPPPRGMTWEEAQPEHAAFVRALVAEIYKRVWQEESWWWEPEREPELEERQLWALMRSREPRRLARLYELAAEHLDDVIGTYEGGLPDDDRLLVEALDPPILYEPEPTDATPPTELPDPYGDERQLAVQRLAVALFLTAEGSGFERLRNAWTEALESDGRLGH